MDPLGSVALPGQRRLERVAVARLASRGALHEPHGRTVGYVDGGQQFEGAPGAHDNVSSQFSSSAAPASPDFSGWNWVALTGPRSTAATNGSPCSARVTTPSASCTA